MTAATPAETAPAPTSAIGWPTRLRWGSAQLDSRRNGLNLIRLILAYSVLIAHGWYISGDGVGPQFDGQNLGGWAVIGFFAISGYLITGSRMAKPLGDYIVHRLARIFPAFIVCLVVTAFAFAPIGYWHVHRSLEGFLTTGTTPINYIVLNATLRMNAYDVAGTPGNVPYAGAWDGSLWSLYYEFLCYVIVAVLLSVAVLRRSPLGLAGAWLLSVGVHAGMGRLAPFTQGNGDMIFLFRLLPFFLAGGLLYSLRERLVLTWPAAVLSVIISVVVVWQVPGWGAQLVSPLIAYGILWFGAVLPCPETIRRNDISYGVYIYAFPVQQLLAIAGAAAWPLALFDVVAAAATVPLAMASWVFLERPIMRRARQVTARPPKVAATPEVAALEAGPAVADAERGAMAKTELTARVGAEAPALLGARSDAVVTEHLEPERDSLAGEQQSEHA